MNKDRLEALSDGVFAIAMTLLIIEVSVADIPRPTNADLLLELKRLAPLVLSYFVSFAVLATFWISHNFFYGSFTKNINRQLVLLNMLYLSFISFIPFSAHLLGTYSHLEVAVVIYGLNVFIIGALSAAVLKYAALSKEIDTAHVSSRLLSQARIRSLLTPMFTLIGILVAYWSIPIALFLYAFPIVFNSIPGTLNFVEWLFGFTLD